MGSLSSGVANAKPYLSQTGLTALKGGLAAAQERVRGSFELDELDADLLASLARLEVSDPSSR